MKFDDKVNDLILCYHRYTTETLEFIFKNSYKECERKGYSTRSMDRVRLEASSIVLRYRGLRFIDLDKGFIKL